MKFTILVTLLAITHIAWSQSNCVSTGSTNCTNGTNTNPNSTYTSPQSNTFKENTFDWTQQSFPINKSDYQNFAPFVPSNPLSNPYYSNASYLSYIAKGADSDFEPEDGWELIKQDFGYVYDATSGTWDGANQTSYNKPIAYFVLYNKYSAKLRVLATTPSQNGTADKVQVNLALVNPNDNPWVNQTVYDDHKASAIFAHSQPIAAKLTDKTEVAMVSSIAAFPMSTQDFFYADFQLAYDPCVCLFQSALHVTFMKIESAAITLNGKVLGTQQTMASISSSSGSMYGDGDASEDFYTQFFAEGQNVQSISQHYSDIENLIDDIEAQSSSAAPELKKMKDWLKLASIVTTVNPKAKALKTGVTFMAKYVDFMIMQGNKGKKVSPTIITSYMNASGTAITNTQLNGGDFYFANPGSCGADLRPEYAQTNSSGTEPNYPMYNEPVGLFALIESPEIKRHTRSQNFWSLANYDLCPIDSTTKYPSLVRKYIDNMEIVWQLDGDDFKFAFHPIVNRSKTIIEAAIEVKGFPDLMNCEGNNDVSSRTNTNVFKVDEDENGVPRYMTDFVQLSCLNEVIFDLGFDYDGDGDAYNNAIDNLLNAEVYVVFTIFYTFNVDAYGNEMVSSQIVKYPLDIQSVASDPRFMPNNLRYPEYDRLRDVSGDITINTTNYSNPSIQAIVSRGTITIDGDLTNQNTNDILIQAQEGINVINGSSIGEGINLKVAPVSEYFCSSTTPIPQMTTSELNTFCSGSSYRAKNFASLPGGNENHVESSTIDLFNIVAYPNPAHDNLNLASSNELTHVQILSIQGTIIETFDLNSSNLEISLSSYPKGVFFIHALDTRGNQTTIKFIKK